MCNTIFKVLEHKEKRPFLIQLRIHSPASIASAPKLLLSGGIKSFALKNTRSASAEIPGIERISLGIWLSRGFNCYMATGGGIGFGLIAFGHYKVSNSKYS